MGRRNHFKGARFTAEELEIIEGKAEERKLSVSDFIRKGALEYAGIKTNPLPEPVERWASSIRETKLYEIFAAEPGTLDRLKRFFGRDRR